MADAIGRMAALQQVQPPATQLKQAEQNTQSTGATSAPGDVNSTESIAGIGSASSAPAGPQSVPDPDELGVAIADLRNSVARFSRSLEFSIDESTDRRVVKVMDTENDKVIRQIPSEEVLALAAQLKEMSDVGMEAAGTILSELAG